MIHLAGPYVLSALLVGIGTFGVLARRNAVLVLIGVELILNGANILLVATGAVGGDAYQAGGILTLFVITIAAAEVCVALAVILALFRLRHDIDLTVAPGEEPDEASTDPRVLEAKAAAQPENSATGAGR